MWLDKLKSLIKNKALPESGEAPVGVKLPRQPQPAGDFQQVLQQERDAADQTGHEFALVVFELNGNAPSDGLAQKLWQGISQRVRPTDKAGWLSSQSFGVILPETPFSDGRKVAEDVCRTLEAAMPLVSYKILTYPPRHDP